MSDSAKNKIHSFQARAIETLRGMQEAASKNFQAMSTADRAKVVNAGESIPVNTDRKESA